MQEKIKDDTICRLAAIEALLEEGQRSKRYRLGDIWELNFDEIRKAIATVPPAEPEIIRCKDCKHWKSNEFIGNNDVTTANLHSYPCKYAITDAEWFCGSAKRRDE